jgi:hypothetical protein
MEALMILKLLSIGAVQCRALSLPGALSWEAVELSVRAWAMVVALSQSIQVQMVALTIKKLTSMVAFERRL